MLISKIKRKLSYEKIDPVIYNENLKEAYSGRSVTGGTLKNKTVLITGASGDIGVSLAIRFIDEGCKAILAGRSEKKLDDAIAYIKGKKNDCNISKLVFDMANSEEIRKAVDSLKSNREKVDILIMNAGFLGGDDRDGVFRNYKKENFIISWKTNYVGVTHLCESMAEYMSNFNGEKIILISSICALDKKARYTPYGMSKAASTAFIRSIREKYPNLSMNIIFPGSVATKMGNIKIGDNIAKKCNKLNRVILPEEIASLAAFLSSDVGKQVKDGIVASACEVF